MYEPPHRVIPGRPFQTILRYNIPYWREYAVGTLLAVVFVTVELAMPLVIRSVVGRFETGIMTGALLGTYFGLLLGIAVCRGIARYWERTLIIGASRKSEYDLRNDYFRHLQALSQGYFHRTQTGDIMARSVNDLNFVRMFIGPGIMGTVDMLRVPLTLAMMIYLSGRLTLISLAPLPLVSLVVYLFVMYMHRQSQRVQEQFSVVNSRVQENLAGARVVKAYGTLSLELDAFAKESRVYQRENLKLAVVMAMAFPLIGFFMALALLLVLWYGGGMVIDGELGLEDFTAFIVCVLMLVWPLAQFGWVLTLYQRGAVGMNRMAEVFGEVPDIRDTEETDSGARVTEGAVRFEDVHLAYGEHAALSGVSFEIPAGQTVAIVGPTGSGKSSIVALLNREFEPTSGRVLVDGIPIERLPLGELRKAIGFVPQDTFLFSATIRENLAFGRPDAGTDAIERASEVAQLGETIAELPEGYDTLLGERGINLSGGQKQRLTIARAVLCDPLLLILDDALSSVDTHTEELILQRLKAFMASRTSIIISHRISTVQHADQILVVDEGRLVEQGVHEDLIESGGLYARMHERQQLERILEEEA